MPGRMPTNMFCWGQPLRLLGWRHWGSDLGSTGKRERCRGTCDADHTSEAGREGQTILRGYPEERAPLREGDSLREIRCGGVVAGTLPRNDICQTPVANTRKIEIE